jgi:hypothetical protein
MKKLRSIIKQLATIDHNNKQELNDLLWEFICYSPQWPLRPHQQQLLDEAEKFEVNVYDEYFSQQELTVNGFKWGNGKQKILITHGWGSKAADFSELIIALRQHDVSIIAFDAPGNGSSEGSLSSLILFEAGVKAVVAHCGAPDISIGHSLGGIANAMGLKDSPPRLFISLNPLIRLKENFVSSLESQKISEPDQAAFFESFVKKFNMEPSDFNMNKVYSFDDNLKHWLAYDDQDLVAPYPYLKDFLEKHPSVIAKKFEGVGHERIIKEERVIGEVAEMIEKVKSGR